MNKQEFLAELRAGLSGLPGDDIEERLTFYGEMIDDRIEEGIEETAAVAEIGSVDEIVAQIVSDTPLSKLVREKITPKRKMKAWEIALLVLGSPLWLALLIAAAALVLSLYAVLWAVLIVLWALSAAAAAEGIAGIGAGIMIAVRGGGLTGLAVAGAELAVAGLAIFAFFGCRAATRGILKLTKELAFVIKNRFIGERKA